MEMHRCRFHAQGWTLKAPAPFAQGCLVNNLVLCSPPAVSGLRTCPRSSASERRRPSQDAATTRWHGGERLIALGHIHTPAMSTCCVSFQLHLHSGHGFGGCNIFRDVNPITWAPSGPVSLIKPLVKIWLIERTLALRYQCF